MTTIVLQHVLYCMIGLRCMLNTWADRRQRGKTSTSFTKTYAFGQPRSAYSRTGSYKHVSGLEPSEQGTREYASERRSASASAGTSPSADPGSRGVDRPARACVPGRTRSTTATPGSPVSVTWGCFPSPIRVSVELCAYTPRRWVFMPHSVV